MEAKFYLGTRKAPYFIIKWYRKIYCPVWKHLNKFKLFRHSVSCKYLPMAPLGHMTGQCHINSLTSLTRWTVFGVKIASRLILGISTFCRNKSLKLLTFRFLHSRVWAGKNLHLLSRGVTSSLHSTKIFRQLFLYSNNSTFLVMII